MYRLIRLPILFIACFILNNGNAHAQNREAYFGSVPMESGQAWMNYLNKRIDFTIPGLNDAPTGVYKVVVEFEVDAGGVVRNVKAKTKKGYGTEWEVIRVIKKSPKWNPAMKDGIPIDSKIQQEVIFDYVEL